MGCLCLESRTSIRPENTKIHWHLGGIVRDGQDATAHHRHSDEFGLVSRVLWRMPKQPKRNAPSHGCSCSTHTRRCVNAAGSPSSRRMPFSQNHACGRATAMHGLDRQQFASCFARLWRHSPRLEPRRDARVRGVQLSSYRRWGKGLAAARVPNNDGRCVLRAIFINETETATSATHAVQLQLA